MFKRVLGIDRITRAQFNDDSDVSSSDDNDSDIEDKYDTLTDKQKRRLQRAMMPLSAIVEGDTSCSSSEDEGEDDIIEEEVGSEAEEEDGDDDDDSTPKVNIYAEQFRCLLCPEKLLLSQEDVDKHKASKGHIKRVHRQEELNKEEEEAVDGNDEKTVAKDNVQKGEISEGKGDGETTTAAATTSTSLSGNNRKMKRKLKMKERRAAHKKRALNDDEIAAKKAKFQAKKDRRQQRKVAVTKDDIQA